MRLCFISMLPQANQDPGFILKYEKMFSYYSLFSHATRERSEAEEKIYGLSTCASMVMLDCVSALLVLASGLLSVATKKDNSVVDFPQTLVLSGRFALEILS